MPWYALHVRSNAERQVQSRLQLAGIEDFAPTYKERSRRLGPDHKPLILERMLFAGYVFSRLEGKPDHEAALRIPAVLRIVGYADEPVDIPDEEIEAIRRMITSPIPVAPHSYISAEVGDRARVVSGPLIGQEGAVVYVKNEMRLVLSIEMLHRSVCAEVDADCLQLIRRNKAA